MITFTIPPGELSTKIHKIKAVVHSTDIDRAVFIGTHNECLEFMRLNRQYDLDMRYLNNGQLGRMSSWVINT